MTDYPTLTITPQWNATQRNRFEKFQTVLGDGYVQTAIGGTRPQTEEWQLKRTAKTSEIDSVQAELETYSGVDAFFWQPSEFYRADKLYTCAEWSKTPIGEDLWEFSTTFTRWYPDTPAFLGGQCDGVQYRVAGYALYDGTTAPFLTINCPSGVYGPVSCYWKQLGSGSLWAVYFRGKDISGSYYERAATSIVIVTLTVGPIFPAYTRCDGLPDNCG